MSALQINKRMLDEFRDSADEALWDLERIKQFVGLLEGVKGEEVQLELRERLREKYQIFSESIDNLIYLRVLVKELLLGKGVDVFEDN